MNEIKTLFCDVGGVLLTNGWDRSLRRKAIDRFQLDAEEFEDRHELVVSAFEKGEMSLDEYLDHTIFFEPRAFTKESVKAFMMAQSVPDAAALDLLKTVAATKPVFMATLNNESLELNENRIARFGLHEIFDVFFSSCYLRARKPDKTIYRMALRMTYSTPESTLFIDDRAVNVDAARACGMNAIRFQNAVDLEAELRRFRLLP